jgi:hypothetical protein
MHLEAVQTICEKGDNLLDFYAKVLVDRKNELHKISKTVVADAYFSKARFITQLRESDFHIVSRFRDDARMTYIIEAKPTGKRGRTKTVGDKVDVNNIDTKYFSEITSDRDAERSYSAIVKSTALKCCVRVVIVQKLKHEKVDDAKIYFSTDTQMTGEEILKIYRTRFQIEFLYRDAKQHTGLTNCQARSKEKMHFHLNMSLTAVSVAKAAHWFSSNKDKRKAFSIANIKTMNYNALLLQRFLSMFDVRTNLPKNRPKIKELLYIGKINA